MGTSVAMISAAVFGDPFAAVVAGALLFADALVFLWPERKQDVAEPEQTSEPAPLQATVEPAPVPATQPTPPAPPTPPSPVMGPHQGTVNVERHVLRQPDFANTQLVGAFGEAIAAI